LTMIKGKIEQNWNPPSVRFAAGDPTVRVTFRILRSGEVVDLALARPSGWSTLDQSAIQAVRASAPLTFPPNDKRDHLDVAMDFMPTR
jgi:TonB family protein